jgi:cytochrome c oxidase assembly protein subunit 15
MKNIVLVSIFLGMIVIVLGAYSRLTDAGLGCLDWPGCYNPQSFSKTTENIEIAEKVLLERPFKQNKAWNEIIQSYFASALAFLILVIFINSLFSKAYNKPLKLPLFLLILVCFQGAFDMWSVTLEISPAMVVIHLLISFSVLSGLFLLYLRLTPYRIPGGDARLRQFCKYSILGIIILTGQITFGVWMSANYAALACTGLPICEGVWYERLDLAGAFSIIEADNYEFGGHDSNERMTIHIIHRIGSLITFLYLCWLGTRLYAAASSNLIKKLSVIMVLVLGAQVILGVSNVVFSLPIVVVLLHNMVAACLMLVLVTISYTLYRKT